MQDQLTLRSGLPAVRGVAGGAAVLGPLVRAGGPFASGEVTEITLITMKADLSRWTRAHEGAPGITWSVFRGEGGTMVIVEHTARDRAAAADAGAPAPVPVLAGAGAR